MLWQVVGRQSENVGVAERAKVLITCLFKRLVVDEFFEHERVSIVKQGATLHVKF